jgi:hypothetical protein
MSGLDDAAQGEAFRRSMVGRIENRIAELERDIANGVETAIPRACGLRAFIEVYSAPPPTPRAETPKKEMTAAEYFLKYGPEAMGRA